MPRNHTHPRRASKKRSRAAAAASVAAAKEEVTKIAILSIVLGVIAAFAFYIYYQERGPVSGIVVIADYDSEYQTSYMVGKIMVPTTVERWSAEIDLDGDGDGDKTIELSEEEFDSIVVGERFER